MNPVESNHGLEVSAEVLATLVEISERINASLDLDDVLATAATLIKRLIEYEIFAVLLIEEGTNQLFFRFAIGHNPQVVENWRIPLGQGITGTAAVTREAVRVGDVSQFSGYLNALDSVRSELAVPLLVKGSCIGVLDIQSNQLDYFTPDQQNILTLLASRLAIAIENARLYEHSRRQTETLMLLNEVGREASSILSLEELLQRAAELVKRVIDYQIFGILLYEEATRSFRQWKAVKYGQSVQEKLTCVTEGIVGAAATSRRPVLVPDVSADPRYIAVNPETRSELAIPLVHKDRVIGVMDLESPQTNYFTEHHVQALSVLAAQLAVSLENARLYEKVARDEARMERELSAARRIQAGLLPSIPANDYGLEIAARYVSAREVGGDLYDFLRYSPQHLGVALGDVSGKGTAAALYCTMAVGILRSLAQQKLAPAEMLRRLNQIMLESQTDDRYLTLCFATWQRSRRRLRVASAGQTQPILWKNGNGRKLPLTGYPLGIFSEASYDDWSATLDPGDIFVLYSDGLSETANARGELFGADRIREILVAGRAASAADLADRIMDEVSLFALGTPAVDDRTLVILKVK